MSDVIHDYGEYKPAELRYLLMAEVRSGDSDELHSACIALCNITDEQAHTISVLQKQVEQLEKRLNAIEADAKSGAVAHYRQSCYENGIIPD